MLRSVSDDWGRHRDPVLSITRLDSAIRRHRPAPDELAASLAGLVPMVEGSLAFGMRKLSGLRAGGFVNSLTTVDYSAGGGLAGQWYHEGVFEAPGGEALLVEADLSGGMDTLSLALTDALGCTLDWANAQTSLNRKQAQIDSRRRLAVRRYRARIRASRIGWTRWGTRVGVMQFRWTGCAVAPAVTFRLVKADSVISKLPPETRLVTPAAREAMLHQRAAGAQLRIYW